MVSPNYNYSVGWGAFLSGGLTGEESSFKLTQAVGCINFFVTVGLRSLEAFCILSVGSCPQLLKRCCPQVPEGP